MPVPPSSFGLRTGRQGLTLPRGSCGFCCGCWGPFLWFSPWSPVPPEAGRLWSFLFPCLGPFARGAPWAPSVAVRPPHDLPRAGRASLYPCRKPGAPEVSGRASLDVTPSEVEGSRRASGNTATATARFLDSLRSLGMTTFSACQELLAHRGRRPATFPTPCQGSRATLRCGR